jgi:tetratricopeptide (TPR) repeat protein
MIRPLPTGIAVVVVTGTAVFSAAVASFMGHDLAPQTTKMVYGAASLIVFGFMTTAFVISVSPYFRWEDWEDSKNRKAFGVASTLVVMFALIVVLAVARLVRTGAPERLDAPHLFLGFQALVVMFLSGVANFVAARWRRLGLEALSSGDFDLAIASFDQILHRDSKDAWAYASRGAAYDRTGDHDRAIADFTDAIRVCPTYASAYFCRGAGYFKKREIGRAITDFSEAIRLNPRDAKALLSRGLSYARNGDNDRAIADFNDAISLTPNDARAYAFRGAAYESKGDNDRAIADLSEAIRLDPTNERAYAERGAVHGRMGDYDGSLSDLNEALRVNPQFGSAFVNRGVSYSRKGDDARALADYTEALRLNPKDVHAYANRGSLYVRKGDYASALADLNEAIRVDPEGGGSGLAYNNFAWLLATCPEESFRDGHKAVQYATTACELRHWKHWPFLGTLAAAYAEVGQFDTAVAWQEKSIELPECPQAEREKGRRRLELYQGGHPYHEERPVQR